MYGSDSDAMFRSRASSSAAAAVARSSTFGSGAYVCRPKDVRCRLHQPRPPSFASSADSSSGFCSDTYVVRKSKRNSAKLIVSSDSELYGDALEKVRLEQRQRRLTQRDSALRRNLHSDAGYHAPMGAANLAYEGDLDSDTGNTLSTASGRISSDEERGSKKVVVQSLV
jgi:hypothetical protein